MAPTRVVAVHHARAHGRAQSITRVNLMKRWIYALVAVVCGVAFLACGAAIVKSYVGPKPTPKHAPFLADGRWAADVDRGSLWLVHTVRSPERRPAPWLCSMSLMRLEVFTVTIMPNDPQQAHFDVRIGSVSLWALAAPMAMIAVYAGWRFRTCGTKKPRRRGGTHSSTSSMSSAPPMRMPLRA